MFGWEFPPHISGGLGTACFGLTRGMSSIPGLEILFVHIHGNIKPDRGILEIDNLCQGLMTWQGKIGYLCKQSDLQVIPLSEYPAQGAAEQQFSFFGHTLQAQFIDSFFNGLSDTFQVKADQNVETVPVNGQPSVGLDNEITEQLSHGGR